MDASNLSEEIHLFQQLLPGLRRRHGDTWAVVSNRRLEGVFPTFEAAATFTLEALGGAKVLIRHTNAPQPHVPFVAIDA